MTSLLSSPRLTPTSLSSSSSELDPLPRSLSEVVNEGDRQVQPSWLTTVVNRVILEGVEILERSGLRPKAGDTLPEEQRYRLPHATAEAWMRVAQRVSQVSMAVFCVAVVAALLRLTALLPLPIWQIWQVAGLAALIVGLIARHAELQLLTQVQTSLGPAG